MNAAGLVVPLGKTADDIALGEGGMDPVDERAAELFVHRTRRANDKDRAAIDVRVVNPHRRVQQADDVVDDGHHRLTARLGVAVGDLDGDLFVIAQQHRRLVLAIIHQ